MAPDLLSKDLVIQIPCTKFIPMAQQDALPLGLKDARISLLAHATFLQEASANKEVAVAWHEKDRSLEACLLERMHTIAFDLKVRLLQAIVADPNLQQISQNKHSLSRGVREVIFQRQCQRL